MEKKMKDAKEDVNTIVGQNVGHACDSIHNIFFYKDIKIKG